MNFIIITGQTATGKTKLAIQMAKKYNGEIINCDSRQVYKKLDIITGKDIKKNSKFKSQSSKLNFDIGYYPLSSKIYYLKSKIWLYDIVDPKQRFSSYDWTQCTLYLIKKLLKQKITPIIVGGSYFYLKHLLYGFDYEVPPNFKLREKLDNKSVKELQKILKGINVQSFNQLNNSDKNNPRRLIRKIEISKCFRKEARIPVLNDLGGAQPDFSRGSTPSGVKNTVSSFLLIGLKYKDKNKLRQAIKTRVEKRLKQGAIEEIKSLLKKGYKKTDPGLKTIGYQQIISYLEGKVNKEEAIKQWITAEVQYAKRQLTFMKKDKNIQWKEI